VPHDIPYRLVVGAAHAWFRLADFRFVVSGHQHVPRTGGAVLAINHISYVDFIMAGYGARRSRRLVRFMAKREVFDHRIAGPAMRSMHHISVDRRDGQGSYDDAVRLLREGEVVGVFPEATISRSFLVKELKSGAVRMAAQADVPLVPVVLWGTQRLMTKDHPRDFSRHKTISVTVGEPLDPHGAPAVSRTAALREAMTGMLDEAIRAYPAEEQPPGSWWLPAAYGGTAPTPEEAKRLDAEELRQRASKRARRRRPTGDALG
jgi:1-acyl-sn-glycerol-3-phosphate acyltransferase